MDRKHLAEAYYMALCNAADTALQCYAVAQQTLTAKGHHDLAEGMGAQIAELVILHRLLRLAANVETPKPTQAPIAARSDKPRGVYGEWCCDPKLCAGKGYCPRDPSCAD